MIRELSIPKNRISVLIGTNGKIKKTVESNTNTKMSINDHIRIKGNALDVLNAENIIKAIGRGFSPENAIELLDEEKTLRIIHLSSSRASLRRIRSRIIGTYGKAKHNIERLTHTKISVYGKTISIIGNYNDVEKAVNAVEKLIAGAQHKSVYKNISYH